MIDYDQISSELIRVAREAIGNRLSTQRNNSLASIIKSHGNGPKPKYPYLVVDYLDTRDENGYLTSEHLQNEDGYFEYSTIKVVAFTYMCRGKNSHSITNELHGYFRLPWVRDSIRNNINAGVLQLTDIIDQPTKIGDKNYIEASEFQIYLNVVDTYADTDDGTGYISTIDLDGELARSEDDPSPLPIDIQVTSP